MRHRAVAVVLEVPAETLLPPRSALEARTTRVPPSVLRREGVPALAASLSNRTWPASHGTRRADKALGAGKFTGAESAAGSAARRRAQDADACSGSSFAGLDSARTSGARCPRPAPTTRAGPAARRGCASGGRSGPSRRGRPISARFFQNPTARPASAAAPSAVVSVTLRPHDRGADEVALELHERVVDRGAAVDPQLADPPPRVRLHGPDQVGRLEGDALQRGAREVGRRRAARDADDRAARARVPVRGAEAREGGHDRDAAVVRAPARPAPRRRTIAR